jgi:hypothetical protein
VGYLAAILASTSTGKSVALNQIVYNQKYWKGKHEKKIRVSVGE